MANANPNRAMALRALKEAEAALVAADADLQKPDPAPTAAPAVAPKAAQAVAQKPNKPKRSVGHSADFSNLKANVAAKLSASLNLVAKYVNATGGTSSDIAKQKFNELVAALNNT